MGISRERSRKSLTMWETKYFAHKKRETHSPCAVLFFSQKVSFLTQSLRQILVLTKIVNFKIRAFTENDGHLGSYLS